jgi:hypothetical protein
MGNAAWDYLKDKEMNSERISFADPILITHCGDRRLLEKTRRRLNKMGLINKLNEKKQGIIS